MKLLPFFCLFLCLSVHAQWTQQTSGTTKTLNEIFFPVSDTGFVAGDSGAILRTFNGGTNWVSQNSGTIKDVNDIYFLNTQLGFVAGDSGYFAKTINGGTSWNVSYVPHTNPIDFGCVYFSSANIGYVGGMENSNNGIIFKTTNGGLSWVVSNSPTSFASLNYVRFAFPTVDTGYALTRGMCMKTVDAGNNWFITDTALVNASGMFSILEDAYFFSADTGYIVGWYNPFSGKTTNGYNWTDQLIAGNQWFSVDFPSRQTGYMIGWGQLVKTTNGGQSWWDISSELVPSMPGVFSMDFTDNNTGYACGDLGFIMKTTNGGTSGVFTNENEKEVSVFPNPVTDEFTIQFNKSETGNIYWKDVLGRVVRKNSFENKNQLMLEKSNLPSGIYLLDIETMNSSFTIKVLIN